jgi:hypothetical protein
LALAGLRFHELTELHGPILGLEHSALVTADLLLKGLGAFLPTATKEDDELESLMYVC